MHAFKIRVMLRHSGSLYILFTIFAASTIIAVAAKSCKGNYEYVDSTKDDVLRHGKAETKINSPSNVPFNGTKKRRRCCPYDFDSKRCKIVDDRVLCGYNKNPDWPQSKDTVVDLHGGCRLRAGRLECGYQHGPYTNARRPPVWDNPPTKDREVGKSQFGSKV